MRFDHESPAKLIPKSSGGVFWEDEYPDLLAGELATGLRAHLELPPRWQLGIEGQHDEDELPDPIDRVAERRVGAELRGCNVRRGNAKKRRNF